MHNVELYVYNTVSLFKILCPKTQLKSKIRYFISYFENIKLNRRYNHFLQML